MSKLIHIDVFLKYCVLDGLFEGISGRILK